MTSLMTALVFRYERRPRTLPAHSREHTSRVTNSHRVQRLLPMNVQSSSACIFRMSKSQHPLVEALSRCRGSLEPSRDGGAGTACDPGGRRNAHALDPQACDLVELPSSAAKTAVRGPRVRAERAPAYSARYRRRRPDFVANEPCPTMLRPGFPRWSHPGLQHASRRSRSSLKCNGAANPAPTINSERRKHPIGGVFSPPTSVPTEPGRTTSCPVAWRQEAEERRRAASCTIWDSAA